YIRGPAYLKLPLLTLGSLGTQIVWSVEMAYGTPYLLELGLSKAAMAAVYTAGPISGLVVQPLIGVLADRSTHRWGRRRPYLLASCLSCSAFVLLLGYARVLAELFGLPSAVLLLTVIAIWGLDFSVNAVMALNRALIFDMLPAEQQADGNAWLARLCGIGSILGFFVGDIDLPNSFPFAWLPSLGSSKGMTASEPQVRCLSLLTVTFILCTHAVVAWAAVEQRLEPVPGYRNRGSPASQAAELNPLRVLSRTWRDFAQTAMTLSTPIKEVLRIQTLSWLCWFPLMFYTTEWVSSVAVSGYLADLASNGSNQQPDMKKLKARGTRAGSHALFLQALVSFTCSLLLPQLLPTPDSEPSKASGLPRRARRSSSSSSSSSFESRGVRLTSLWTLAHFSVALVTWLTWPVASSKSIGAATILIAMAGYSWSVTSWGPYSLLGILIQSGLADTQNGAAGAYQSVPMSDGLSNGTEDDSREAEELASRRQEAVDEDEEAILSFDPSRPPDDLITASGEAAGSHQAGTILGIHNTAIVIPQLFVSLLASVIFAFYDNRGSSTTDQPGSAPAAAPATSSSQGDTIGLVFRLGGIASIAAGFYTIRLARQWGDVIAG
ncbi:hypothetical protein BCV69DRAFT_233639, partial [Microstroma glucosiphilum]